MKILVIMPVTVEPYQTLSNNTLVKSAKNPELKFIRAVSSFLEQTHNDKELIVIHDGCMRSLDILRRQFSEYINSGLITSIMLPKQAHYSGKLRNEGIKKAKGEVVCYLDADDYFGKNHLSIIDQNFDINKYDWIYFNDYILKDSIDNLGYMRDVHPVAMSIGTSSIAHKKTVKAVWSNYYGHDWGMIQQYLLPLEKRTKIPTPEYFVCHVSGLGIDC